LAEFTVRERTVNRRALVRLSAGTKVVDTTPVSFDWSLQLTAPDPLRYGSDVHRQSCGLPRPGAGITLPLAFPLQFGNRSAALWGWRTRAPPLCGHCGRSPGRARNR